jgi:hypothetical protein
LQPLPDMQNTPASNKLAYMIFITTLRAQKDGTKFPPPRRAGPQVETGGLAKVSMVDHSSFNRLSRNRRSRSERYQPADGCQIFSLFLTGWDYCGGSLWQGLRLCRGCGAPNL